MAENGSSERRKRSGTGKSSSNPSTSPSSPRRSSKQKEDEAPASPSWGALHALSAPDDSKGSYPPMERVKSRDYAADKDDDSPEEDRTRRRHAPTLTRQVRRRKLDLLDSKLRFTRFSLALSRRTLIG